MSEVSRAITRRNWSVIDAKFLQRVGFESFCIRWNLFTGQRVPFQIQQRCREILQRVESLIKLAGLDDLVQQLLRNLFSGFIVLRVVRKNGWLDGPVFFEGRRELYKVPRRRSARDRRISHV